MFEKFLLVVCYFKHTVSISEHVVQTILKHTKAQPKKQYAYKKTCR